MGGVTTKRSDDDLAAAWVRTRHVMVILFNRHLFGVDCRPSYIAGSAGRPSCRWRLPSAFPSPSP
eukprot:scaffold201561_cov18-Prasinocladus_malaysianus.AAC.1